MAKFAGTSVTPGQATQLDQAAAALPQQQLEQATPQASSGSSLFDKVAEASVEDVAAGVQAGAEAEIGRQEQLERERVPTIAERAADTQTVHKWDPTADYYDLPAAPKTDGGLKARAGKMATIFSGPEAMAKLSITPSTDARAAALEGDTATVAAVEAENQAGSLTAALNRSGAVTTTQDPVSRQFTNTIDPVMLQVGSAVTENMFSDASFGDTDADIQDIDPDQPTPTITKAQGNAQLGQEIHREYMRMRNAAEGKPTDQYQDLPHAEAVTMGDAFKEMYHTANPTILRRGQSGDQVVFQLTPEGVEAMKKGSLDRKRLFPKKAVRPAKAPLQSGQLPGEQGRTVTKRKTGKVKKALAGAEVLNEATRNLAQVPNVVDPQRMKILFATILPVLSGQLDVNHPFAEINNIGKSKMQSFLAGQAEHDRAVADGKKVTPYSAEAEMASLQNTVAQEVRAIAQERKGANYLSYTIQSVTGRIMPQQSYFDPTTSKAVRFVTRNAVPAPAAPNSRVARNLEEMYAMMLVGKTHVPRLGRDAKADELLPDERVKAFGRNAKRLEAWGDRLAEVLGASMTDAQVEAIADAIAEGIPLTDPSFPQVGALALDPQQDAELIAAIESKGEDGPHFIDGLIDAANYIKAKRDGRTYHSYFNAYVDGKTNGIASNGIQMGSKEIATATGVLRTNEVTLLDDGDVRDQLKDNLLQALETDGLPGHLMDEAPELYAVARTLYGTRNLNKATTMTFSYGKELESFRDDIGQYIDLNAASDPEFAAALSVLDNNPAWGREKVVDALHKFYVDKLGSVLSEEALQSRGLVRSAALMHALTNQLFTIKSATGFELMMGGTETKGFDAENATRYKLTEEGGATKDIRVGQYETEHTSAAIQRDFDEEGNLRETPGQAAYGQSVTSPVHSIDAATVALSAAGKSWQKMRAASNGNPYMHTIYDAFKFDAMGFDVGVQEVNKNWFDASFNWSYLEATQEATRDAMTAWHNEMKQKPQGELVDITMKGPYRMVGWLFQTETTDKGPRSVNLESRLKKTMDVDAEDAKQAAGAIKASMKNAGLDPNNMPDQITVAQLRTIVGAFATHLNLNNRLTSMINKTDMKKKELKKALERQGTPNYQYYAH